MKSTALSLIIALFATQGLAFDGITLLCKATNDLRPQPSTWVLHLEPEVLGVATLVNQGAGMKRNTGIVSELSSDEIVILIKCNALTYAKKTSS